MRRRTAFTLVELLMVIGIIALLAAILMPMLTKAKAQADALKCLTNMRQIGQGIIMYMGDYKRSLPGPTWVGQQSIYKTGEQKLAYYLAPYSGSPRITSTTVRNPLFICPTADAMVPENYVTFSIDRPATSYRLHAKAPAVKIFGYPVYEGKPMVPPMKYPTQIVNASSFSILREVDWMNAVGTETDPWLRPSKPVHGRLSNGSRRNKLFFDFHVETVVEKDAVDLTPDEL